MYIPFGLRAVSRSLPKSRPPTIVTRNGQHSAATDGLPAPHRRAIHLGSSDEAAKLPNVVQRKRRLVVGVTGASGALLAIRLLEILRALDVETHLIFSKWSIATMRYETDVPIEYVQSLATRAYAIKDMTAPPSSGSFLHDGMIVVPCSMKTLAAVRAGYCDDLISRSADVCLKEGRRLVLAVRETPLSAVHLDNMAFLQRAGAVIFPPVPALYTRPKSIQDIVDQSVGRMLDSLGIHVDTFQRWDGGRMS
ncbi:Phenylacrylic acid decarboxylase protein [Neofusicoccum parvum]|uniref:Phenylacrylic acid decarboxylase protein n=1 Tax=Neofusicoccum parvum TaxID=310453 RepID=A0ACB5SCR9_9PEZI|nr:Phenylacrylic acid decarboxylase protein [Neofusicoccum parvum]